MILAASACLRPRADLLQHLTKGADVAQPACASQANVRLVTLGLEVVDVVGVHDPLPTSREVQQHLALSQCHGKPFVPHPRSRVGTNGKLREQTTRWGNRRQAEGTNAGLADRAKRASKIFGERVRAGSCSAERTFEVVAKPIRGLDGRLPGGVDERAILHGLVFGHKGYPMSTSRGSNEPIGGVPREVRRELKRQRRDLWSDREDAQARALAE
jgi:hypothetical protein